MSEQHAPKTWRPNRAMKAANAVMRVLAAAGLVPRAVVLTVLKRYVAVAPLTLPSFSAGADDPVDAFVTEAARHPVFELTAIDG